MRSRNLIKRFCVCCREGQDSGRKIPKVEGGIHKTAGGTYHADSTSEQLIL
jgi:hypothetical protein